MKKYLVQAYETITTFYDVIIEAENEEEARELAQEEFFNYDAQEIDCRSDYFEIQTIKEIEE